MDTAQFTSLFSATNRLFTLAGPGPIAALQIERWVGHEALSENFQLDVYVLGTDPGLDTQAMLGQRVTVQTALPEGGTATRSGLVAEAACLGYDDGLARYHLQLVPWSWALTQGRDQRSFSNKTLADILDAVFGDYQDIARWRYTADATERINAIGPCDYKVQYRSHDNFDFVSHLLADAGLGFCFEEDTDAPSGHTLVIFDDSAALPEDDVSVNLGGVPYRMAGMTADASDAILSMGESVSLMPDRVTILSSDYRSRQSTTAAATMRDAAGNRELYDDVGPEAFSDSRQAEDTARRQAEAIESKALTWVGYSTLHTAQTGRAVQISGAPWVQAWSGSDSAPTAFLLTEVRHVGINNLPQTVMQTLERTLGPTPLQNDDTRLAKQAQSSGYANHFHAVPRLQPWRHTLADGAGQRLNPVPTALGAQTAIVAGPQNETRAGASGPVHTDVQGRLWPRYHWQADGDTGSFATRSMQRLASDGHGMQLTPRIGQEVLVQFANGLVHRPIILGGLYNGGGEGGATPTPGGAAGQPVDNSVYAQARDGVASAQANLKGGNSPAWHGAGAGADAHGHAGALSGFKSQGFDGNGYNQLVMDDSDGMGRVQMGTSQAATQLNLGHLRHQADNYVGSFRGQGFELRTDAYGAVRGTRGTLITSYPLQDQGRGAGEAAGAQNLLSQLGALSQSLDKAAEKHLTLPLAAQRGVNTANQSKLDQSAAPLKALDQTFKTTVSGEGSQQGFSDAAERSPDKSVPHTGDSVLGIAAQGGQGILAGQSLQWAAGETLTVGSGKDTNLAVADQLRIHSGQGIGWLAGAEQASGVGLSVIAGKDNVDLQAQHDTMALRSKSDLNVVSVNAAVEMAAGKTVHLATTGGAYLTIEGGNITVACPGNLVIHAAQHKFIGPAQLNTPLPSFPNSKFKLDEDFPMSI